MKWRSVAAVGAVIGFTAFLIAPIFKSTNNVCKTFSDYYSDRDKNENCHYNPDYKLEVPDIIKRHGYPVETHRVITKDGYILSVFRIPHGKNTTPKTTGRPVFIQHGFTLNSGAFLTSGRKSLGFVLADAGYDVWLGNFRGSRYSNNHTHLHSNESEFWNFSFHEHGIYDVPAQVDHVHRVTKQKIIYIGFSMGGSSAYIYGITYPDSANEKLEILIGLAPSSFVDEPARFSFVTGYIWTLIKDFVQIFTKGQIYTRPYVPNKLFKYLCLPLPIQMKICQIPDMFVIGVNYDQYDPETLPAVLQYNSDATSIKTFTHFLQLIDSGNFQYFDYGSEENKKIYGSVQPPHYDLSKVKFPSYLIYAKGDIAMTDRKIKTLYELLPKETRRGIHSVKDETFTHMDIIAGKDAKALVFDHIVTFLDNHLR